MSSFSRFYVGYEVKLVGKVVSMSGTRVVQGET